MKKQITSCLLKPCRLQAFTNLTFFNYMQNKTTDAKPAVDAVADDKVNAEVTKESSDKNIGNPITPVPNADKDCDASPPKLKNKTIKRKLKVLDADSVSPADESQPKKIMKIDKEIKTA